MLSSVVTLLASLNSAYASVVPPHNCNYIVPFGDGSLEPEELPSYAMDVCRKDVTDGVAVYSKYGCSNETIWLAVYDNQDCSGEPLYDNFTIYMRYNCENVGTCNYVMVKTPCDDENNYSTYPYITGLCQEVPSGTLQSYGINCTGLEIYYDHVDGMTILHTLNEHKQI